VVYEERGKTAQQRELYRKRASAPRKGHNGIGQKEGAQPRFHVWGAWRRSSITWRPCMNPGKPGARMVGDPAYPSSAAGPGRGLRTRTRGKLRQRRGGGRRSRCRRKRVAAPESGGWSSDTVRDDGRRRSGTSEGPRRGCLSGRRGNSETVPGPGAVG